MLPETLEIPEVLASTLVFDPTLNARDRSMLFAVSWYAARNDAGDGDECHVPDLPLRRALGDLRRPDEDRETARYRRLESAVMRGDEMPDLSSGVLVPTVPAGMRRITLSGKRVWIIDERIRRSFSVYDGDAVVGVPLPVLARARCRYTLPLALRLSAWGAGGYLKRWLRRDREDHVVLRLTVADLIAELGIEGKRSAGDLLRDDIMPAVEELQALTDIAIDIAPYHAPSLRKPKGRVLGYDILVDKAPLTIATSGLQRAPKPAAEIVALHGPDWTPPGSDATDEDIEFW